MTSLELSARDSSPSDPAAVAPPARLKPLVWAVIVLIAVVGIFLRAYPSVTFTDPGPDEMFYKKFIEMTAKYGVFSYPEIVAQYIAHQKEPSSLLMLPPLRIAFIWPSYAVHHMTGMPPLRAAHVVACAASIAALFIAGVFAWRTGGRSFALAVSAMVAVAPLQIYSAQRALIDGFFAMTALLCLWALWENLQKPNDRRWLAVYGFAIAVMVCTKENAFFVYLALGGILLASHWLKFGRATSSLYIVTIAAPAVAMLVLLVASGSPDALIDVYRTNVQKSVVAPYALKTGDGPWHRYLSDLLLMHPVVILLAIGAFFRLTKAQRPAIYLALFIGVTYLIMCQVRYGMNMRYAMMWDMPLRWLAFWHLTLLTSTVRANLRTPLLAGAVLLICLVELRAYHLFFVEYGIYDPVPEALGKALEMLK